MLYQKGQISDLYQDEPFETRLISIEKEAPNASVWLHKQPFEMPSAFQELWSHKRLLDIAEQLIGPKIAGHPVSPVSLCSTNYNHTRGKAQGQVPDQLFVSGMESQNKSADIQASDSPVAPRYSILERRLLDHAAASRMVRGLILILHGVH